jgi:hypothetical protein
MRTGWVGPAVLALALGTALVGCAKQGETPGIASANGSVTTAPSGGPADNLTEAERRVKFAECMRGKGIDVPDPEEGEAGAGFRLQLGDPNKGGPGPEKVEAAMQACKQYLPNGGEPPKLSAEDLEKARQHSKCMRENGVTEFPDPDPNGGVRIQMKPGSSLDPSSETFKAADEKCRHLRPTGGPRRVSG